MCCSPDSNRILKGNLEVSFTVNEGEEMAVVGCVLSWKSEAGKTSEVFDCSFPNQILQHCKLHGKLWYQSRQGRERGIKKWLEIGNTEEAKKVMKLLSKKPLELVHIHSRAKTSTSSEGNDLPLHKGCYNADPDQFLWPCNECGNGCPGHSRGNIKLRVDAY